MRFCISKVKNIKLTMTDIQFIYTTAFLRKGINIWYFIGFFNRGIENKRFDSIELKFMYVRNDYLLASSPDWETLY